MTIDPTSAAPASNPLANALCAPLASRGGPLLHLEDGSSRTGAEVDGETRRIAAALRAAGVEPGDRVAAQVEKSPAALSLYLACLRLGAIYLPLNPAYTDVEIAYFVEDAEPAALVCDPRRAAGLSAVAGGATIFEMDADGRGPLTAGGAAFDAITPRSPDDVATILYTSGTTGRAKGAMLSHGNLLANAETLRACWRFTAEDVLLHALPLFHAHGLYVAANVSLLAGAQMIFLPKFELESLLAALPRATALMGVPTFYTRLLADPRLSRETAGHLRVAISGSAPLFASTWEAFKARTGLEILERYGMTETSMNASNPYEGARKPGTVGPPLPGVEARVVDADSGAPLPVGEAGALEVRGPNVFKGYWRMPAKTASEFREDGFFITGDLAQVDADGYLTIVGRAKDLVISGGYNVYPKEVEDALDALEGVAESAVYGAPHPDFGEGVVAEIVRDVGSAAAPSETEIIAAIRERLAAYKTPKRVFFTDALPRNAMGKVQKKLLRERRADLFVETGDRA
ncbi:MAG: AMP-binding protein [Pseudomonadota bacterium]